MTEVMAIEPEEFWRERLGIRCGGYNSAIDEQIMAVARLIGEGSYFCDDIAVKLGLSVEHVELIQYILASVTYPASVEAKNFAARTPFEYGTSPRGLFAGDRARLAEFLAEFEAYMTHQWAEEAHG